MLGINLSEFVGFFGELYGDQSINGEKEEAILIHVPLLGDTVALVGKRLIVWHVDNNLKLKEGYHLLNPGIDKNPINLGDHEGIKKIFSDVWTKNRENMEFNNESLKQNKINSPGMIILEPYYSELLKFVIKKQTWLRVIIDNLGLHCGDHPFIYITITYGDKKFFEVHDLEKAVKGRS